MQPSTASSNFPEIKVPALLTFLALIVGFVIGNLFQGVAGFAPILAAAEEVGGLWLKLLQLTILPLVIGLVVTGISQTLAAAGGGRLARRAVLYFVVVLLFAGVMAALLVPALLDWLPIPSAAAAALSGGGVDAGKVPGFADILDAMVPNNIFSAAANNAMLPVVLFAAVFALALTRIAQGTRQLMVQFFEGLAAAMMVIVGWVLMLAPLGVFGLAVSLAAQTGADAIGGLAHYILIVSAAGLVVLLASVVIALTLGGRSPGAFARAMVPVFAVAISTQSSLASLPAMLAASRKLGVRGLGLDAGGGCARRVPCFFELGVPARHAQLRRVGRPDRHGDGGAHRAARAARRRRDAARHHAYPWQRHRRRGGHRGGGSEGRAPGRPRRLIGPRLTSPRLHWYACSMRVAPSGDR